MRRTGNLFRHIREDYRTYQVQCSFGPVQSLLARDSETVRGIPIAVRGTIIPKGGTGLVSLGRGSGSWDRPAPIRDGLKPIRDRAKQTGIGFIRRWEVQKCPGPWLHRQGA